MGAVQKNLFYLSQEKVPKSTGSAKTVDQLFAKYKDTFIDNPDFINRSVLGELNRARKASLADISKTSPRCQKLDKRVLGWGRKEKLPCDGQTIRTFISYTKATSCISFPLSPPI